LEIAGKFIWGDETWVAGEMDPPTIPPGRYVIRASISCQEESEPTIFEWDLVNEGAGKPLVVKRR